VSVVGRVRLRVCGDDIVSLLRIGSRVLVRHIDGVIDRVGEPSQPKHGVVLQRLGGWDDELGCRRITRDIGRNATIPEPQSDLLSFR
jgi:hypothetical protein